MRLIRRRVRPAARVNAYLAASSRPNGFSPARLRNTRSANTALAKRLRS